MAVYFIQCGGVDGPVKIGYTTDVAKRLRCLQCAHHETLVLLRQVDGGFALEAWLRERYRHLHIRGEWHRFDPEMLTVDVAGAEETHQAARKERSRARAREAARRKGARPRTAGLDGYSLGTRADYQKDWRTFCIWRGLGESMPVTDAQILTYLDTRLAGRKRHAVANVLCAISTVHQALGGDRLTLRPAVKAWLRSQYPSRRQ